MTIQATPGNENKMIFSLTKKQILILSCIVFVAIVITGVGAGLFIQRDINNENSEQQQNVLDVKDIPYGTHGGAVTNGPECAGIARDTIYKGGSVVDAGIAAAICEGASMAQSMGLGGGFFATIYIKKTGEVFTLNARETAPAAASRDMYVNNPDGSKNGGLAVAIPGDVRGYQYLHQRFGVLPWRELFQPTIKLCRTGLVVNGYLDKLYKNNKDLLMNNKDFSDFINPKTGVPYQKDEKLKRLKLADTLEIIASEPDALHQGSLTKGFVEDIQNLGGIITAEDMNNYKPIWMDPITVPLWKNQTLHTFPPPGSGAIMGFILALLQNNVELETMNTVNNWQRIIESFKFAYGMRTKLGDPVFEASIEQTIRQLTSPEFVIDTRKKIRDNVTSQDPNYYYANVSVPEDHGTAHINVLAPNGDAFAFTGTINLIFGAKVVSNSTGIILNNEMDDFSTQESNYFGLPATPMNFIEPGKRPLSSMCPSIVIDDNGDVRMVLGAAGGSKITSSSALVAMRHLWFGQTVRDAIRSPRMHHQLLPMRVSYDPEFNPALMDALKRIGHQIEMESPDGFGAVTAVSNHSGNIQISSDSRRCGACVPI